MQVKKVGLSWIVVRDIKQAIQYYTETVGLKLMEFSEEYGWAELQGYEGGERLGLAQSNPHSEIPAGANAVVTFSVENLDVAKKNMVEKGAKVVGEIIEVPGHVKMQTMVDQDGNTFQLCELINP